MDFRALKTKLIGFKGIGRTSAGDSRYKVDVRIFDCSVLAPDLPTSPTQLHVPEFSSTNHSG